MEGCDAHLPCVAVPVRILDKGTKDFTACLEERVSDDDLEETLEAFPTVFNHVVGEAVCEDFAWERWDCYL